MLAKCNGILSEHICIRLKYISILPECHCMLSKHAFKFACFLKFVHFSTFAYFLKFVYFLTFGYFLTFVYFFQFVYFYTFE